MNIPVIIFLMNCSRGINLIMKRHEYILLIDDSEKYPGKRNKKFSQNY